MWEIGVWFPKDFPIIREFGLSIFGLSRKYLYFTKTRDSVEIRSWDMLNKNARENLSREPLSRCLLMSSTMVANGLSIHHQPTWPGSKSKKLILLSLSYLCFCLLIQLIRPDGHRSPLLYKNTGRLFAANQVQIHATIQWGIYAGFVFNPWRNKQFSGFLLMQTAHGVSPRKHFSPSSARQLLFHSNRNLQNLESWSTG